MHYVRRFAEHGLDDAVAGFREFDGSRHTFLAHMMAGEDMFHRDLHKDLWVRLSTHAVDAQFVARHVLAHLLQDRNHAHARAASQGHQQHFHRTHGRVRLLAIECHAKARIRLGLETPACLPPRRYMHLLCHCVLLFIDGSKLSSPRFEERTCFLYSDTCATASISIKNSSFSLCRGLFSAKRMDVSSVYTPDS